MMVNKNFQQRVVFRNKQAWQFGFGFVGGIMRVNHIAFLVAIAMVTGMIGGCKSSSTNPDVDQGITEANLFPFGVGRSYVYSAYTLDTLGVKVQSSIHREVTYVQGTVTIGGKSGYRLIDSVYFNDGTYAHADTSYYTVENGNLLTYQGAWITLFKPSEKYTTSKKFVAIEGQTKPRSFIRVNDYQVPIKPDGKFSWSVFLQEGSNKVQVVVTDRKGRVSTLERTVIKEKSIDLEEEKE